MYIARILYPVKVLGPGKRICIWFAGCKHMCRGCSNPELWSVNEKYFATIDQVEKLIRSIAVENVIDGFTITGGDPMDQAVEIADLLEKVKDISEDVMLYTGYEIAELTSDAHKKLLDKVAVLIDGKYEEDLNDNSFLRGSSNQTIHILKEKFNSKYCNYINDNHNKIQNFMINNEVVSVGIHKKDFIF